MKLINIGDTVRVFGFRERWALNRVENSFFKTLWMMNTVSCFPSNEILMVDAIKNGKHYVFSHACIGSFWLPEEILELVEVAVKNINIPQDSKVKLNDVEYV